MNCNSHLRPGDWVRVNIASYAKQFLSATSEWNYDMSSPFVTRDDVCLVVAVKYVLFDRNTEPTSRWAAFVLVNGTCGWYPFDSQLVLV